MEKKKYQYHFYIQSISEVLPLVISPLKCAMFQEKAQPIRNCFFRTFRVEESFWTKKQSCNLSKVDIKKWRPFFDFVCFNGCHILKLRYLRRDSMEFQNFLFSVLSLTYIFIIHHALLCCNLQGYDHVSRHQWRSCMYLGNVLP